MSGQFIRESFDEYLINKKKFKIKANNHSRLVELFSNVILENSDNGIREDVVKKIEANDYEKSNPSQFREALNKSKHSLMLSDYSEADFAKMKLFKLSGYNIGFALKQRQDSTEYDEIVSVFNNEPGVKGIGEILLQSAVKNGGRYLDHFDGFLTDLYQKAGFAQYARDKYNPEYDEGGKFKEKYGESDVIYRKFTKTS